MRISDWSSDVCSSDLLRNSVAASSSSALAKAGSRPARSLTVSLKSRVIVMSSPFRRCLARLVFALEQSRSLDGRSEEHTSELQSLIRISYAVFCLKKKTTSTSIRADYTISTLQYDTAINNSI